MQARGARGEPAGRAAEEAVRVAVVAIGVVEARTEQVIGADARRDVAAHRSRAARLAVDALGEQARVTEREVHAGDSAR